MAPMVAMVLVSAAARRHFEEVSMRKRTEAKIEATMAAAARRPHAAHKAAVVTPMAQATVGVGA